jgi:diguanylate cyclase (GGDEF)-like protein
VFRLFPRGQSKHGEDERESFRQLLLPFPLEQQHLFSAGDGLERLRMQRDKTLAILQVLKAGLDAVTLVLLLLEPKDKRYSIYAAVSDRKILAIGSFPIGAGVFGPLKISNELTLSPYTYNHPQIPYLQEGERPRFFHARRITLGDDRYKREGVLCIERNHPQLFNVADETLIVHALDQISWDISLVRELFITEFERNSLAQAFNGFQLLAPLHDLESVCSAAAKAVKLIVNPDLIAISIIEENQHRLQHIEGDLADDLKGTAFDLNETLVGQAVKYRRVVPETLGNTCRSPVLHGCHALNVYASLMIFPLVIEGNTVLGVIIVAARREKQFSKHQRDMLELIASQVAIKIDLGQAHEQINRMVLTDPLTGIANRRAFERGFKAIYERAQRREGMFSLLICDIDYFKQVNDVYGHSCGDLVLQQVARQLQLLVRTGDLAARVGGEEFAVLLEESTSRGALDVAERLRRQIETLPLYWNGVAFQVTLSIGVAHYPSTSQTIKELYDRADQALYRAKDTGRNRCCLWHK